MTDDQIIKAVAELVGWTRVFEPPDNKPCKENEYWDELQLPPYLTSLDAIVPVVEKQRFKDQFFFKTFQECLVEVIQRRKPDWKVLDYPTSISSFESIVATPRQLCEALLRATGKWTE